MTDEEKTRRTLDIIKEQKCENATAWVSHIAWTMMWAGVFYLIITVDLV